MKSVKFITTFLLLFVLSIFISYANIEGNNWTDNFIETFKQTNAKFKYYDIKINSTVSNEKTEKDIKNMQLDSDIKLELKKGETVLDIYDLETQLEKADNRKVWLKCGGFITIDKTEALTAIDVNSGKYVGTKDLAKTIFTVNKEATVEIAKQVRLRDIGGIIIIDYIDMENKDDKEKILKELEENLKKDRSKTQVIGFTPLDLLEMTRKHMWSND